MGFLSPKPPAYVPPPVITPPPAPPPAPAADSVAQKEATDSAAALERNRKGRKSTILTGGLGVQGQAATEVKRLLGA